MYISTCVALRNVGDGGDWEVIRQFCAFLLHVVLEQCLSRCVVGEGEVELFLGEWLHEFFVHLPRFVGRSNDCHSIFLFQHLLLILCEHLT